MTAQPGVDSSARAELPLCAAGMTSSTIASTDRRRSRDRHHGTSGITRSVPASGVHPGHEMRRGLWPTSADRCAPPRRRGVGSWHQSRHRSDHWLRGSRRRATRLTAPDLPIGRWTLPLGSGIRRYEITVDIRRRCFERTQDLSTDRRTPDKESNPQSSPEIPRPHRSWRPTR